MHQLGQAMSTVQRQWGLDSKVARTIVLGDFNDPIFFQKELRLIDHSTHPPVAFQAEGVMVTNDEVLSILKRRLGVREYLHVRELKGCGILSMRGAEDHFAEGSAVLLGKVTVCLSQRRKGPL